MWDEFTKGAREAILGVIANDAAMDATIAVDDRGGTVEQMNKTLHDEFARVYDAICDSTNEELLVRLTQVPQHRRETWPDDDLGRLNLATMSRL